MKEIFKKTIISIIAILTLLTSLVLPNKNFVYAADTVDLKAEEEKYIETGWEGGILDGIVGMLSWIPRACTFALASALRAIIAGITAVGGGDAIFDIEGIIFTDAGDHKGAEIVSVDFFNISSGNRNNTSF